MSEGKYRKKESEVSFPAKRKSSNKTSNEEQAKSFIYEKQVCLNDERVNDDKTNAKDVIGLNETDVKVSVNGNGEDDRFYDTASEHAGEEQVDIGLKDLPLTGAPNIYIGKRNFIHQLMDVALLMANVSQLKALLSIDSGDKYFYPLLVFIIMSISLQVIFTVTMLLIWSIEKGLEDRAKTAKDPSQRGSIVVETELSEIDEKKRALADRLDKLGNILVLSIIVSNVFITGFGVEPHDTGNSSGSNG